MTTIMIVVVDLVRAMAMVERGGKNPNKEIRWMLLRRRQSASGSQVDSCLLIERAGCLA